MLWQEAQLARERVNARIATEAILLDAVISAQMSTAKSARDRLNDLIKGLTDGR